MVQIVTPVSEHRISLSSGARVAALAIGAKDAKDTWALTETGKAVRISARSGKTVRAQRMAELNSYAPALPGDALAARLESVVAGKEGVALFESAVEARSKELRTQFGGKEAVFVPFDESKNPVAYTVGELNGWSSQTISLVGGLSGAVIPVAYDEKLPPAERRSDVFLGDGYLVGSMEEAKALPRNSEYGGPAERAAFALVSSGMADFSDKAGARRNFEVNADPAFPRGAVDLVLKTGEQVTVGVDAADELKVLVSRDYRPVHEQTASVRDVTEALGLVTGTLVLAQAKERELAEREVAAQAVKLGKEDYDQAAGKFMARAVGTFNYGMDELQSRDVARALELLDKGKEEPVKFGRDRKSASPSEFLESYSNALANRGDDGDGVAVARQAMTEVRMAKLENQTDLTKATFGKVGEGPEWKDGWARQKVVRINAEGKPIKSQVYEVKGDDKETVNRIVARMGQLIQQVPGRDISEAGLRATKEVTREMRLEEKEQASKDKGRD